MSRRTVATAALTLALVAASPAWAGRDAPITNLENVPVMWVPGTEQSAETVAKAIISACARLGWVCRIAAPGQIEGRLNLRSHQADVHIPYSVDNYSILYVASENLRHDPAKNTIHRNYNNWVLNLQRQINGEIAAAP